MNVETDANSSLIKETSKSFFAIDVNNDGVSDILRLSPVNITTSSNTTKYETYLYVSLSQRGNDGNITYKSPKYYALGPNINLDKLSAIIGGARAMDFDGDGYNDITIPVYNNVNGQRWEYFYIMFGKELSTGTASLKSIAVPLVATSEHPLFETFDINGDGMDDVFYLEKSAKDNVYNGGIISSAGGTMLSRDSIGFKFDKDPQKLFSADFNGDGLNDLIFFYDGGYKIYFNNGGSASATHFSETNTQKGTNLGNCFRIVQGDFDGDGRMDFFYYIKDNDYNIAINNGDGTFTLKEKALVLKDVSNQSTNKDNDRFTVLVYDMDNDGRSDIILCKANYVHHGGLKAKNSYKNTTIKRIYSNADSFLVAKTVTTERAEDADPQYLFIADIDGDGVPELANYGTELYTGNSTNTDVIHIYKVGTDFTKAKQ